MIEDDGYRQYCTGLTDVQRYQEMENIYELIPRVVFRPITDPSWIQGYHQETQNRIQRVDSDLELSNFRKLRTLLGFSHFTNSGKNLLVVEYGMLFENGIGEGLVMPGFTFSRDIADLVAQGASVLDAIYGWEDNFLLKSALRNLLKVFIFNKVLTLSIKITH